MITNNGTKVTEFYVYGEGERVMGEVENISPGLQRKLIVQLTEPGTYQTACKPGMIGDGIRGDFTVTGDAVQIDTEGKFKEAADSYKRYVNSQTDALIPATEVVRRRRQDAATSPPPRRSSRSRAPTTSASSRSPSRSPTTSTRASTCARPTWSPARSGPASTRLEKELWVTGLQPDTNALADQLVADVKELDAGVKAPDFTIDSTQIAGGAQGLLDEIATSKITGEEDIFSHTDLWDFNANVQGSQTAVASVRPILDERNPDLGKRVDQRFAEVEALLREVPRG